jgi:hypothetical protein
MIDPGMFAAAGLTFYAMHHVGDYWLQTGHQARHKGDRGHAGRTACVAHVATYVTTQTAGLTVLATVTGWAPSLPGALAALAVSAGTHYLADRREHGLLYWLALRMGGGRFNAEFMKLGVPRDPRVIEAWFDCAFCKGVGAGGQAADATGRCDDCLGHGHLPSALTVDDNPSLGTGPWALDQAWHIFWGVWVAALLVVGL